MEKGSEKLEKKEKGRESWRKEEKVGERKRKVRLDIETQLM